MNGAQKAVVSSAAIVLAIALLFPPFSWQAYTGVVFNEGFHLITAPPLVEEINGHALHASVNVPLLAVEYLVITTIAGAFLGLFRG